jgi:O-antigen/teichoic acid export membrane protein
MDRIKLLVKEGSWIVVGQIATFGGSLVMVRVLTEYLEPMRYGELALGLTVAGLMNATVMGVVSNSIIRFYPIAIEKKDFYGYRHAVRRLILYATLVTLVVGFLLIAGLFLLGFRHWTGLAIASIAFSLLGSYNGVFNGIQNAARQRSIVAFHGALDAWLKIGLSVAMIYWLGNSGTAVLIGFSSSAALILFSQLLFFRRVIPKNFAMVARDDQLLRKMWVYSFPFLTWGLIGGVQQSSARWALEIFESTEAVGLYSVLSQLGYVPVQIIAGMVMSFLMPILFARYGDGTSSVRNNNVNKLINNIAILGFALTFLGVFVAAVLHSYIFQLLVNESYSSISHFLPWVVFAGGIFSIGVICASKLMGLMMTNELIPAAVGSSIIGIASAIVGVYYFALAGAVSSMIIHSISYLLWVVYKLRTVSARSIVG